MSTWLAITLVVMLVVFVVAWFYVNVVMEWDVELGRIDGEWIRFTRIEDGAVSDLIDYHDQNVRSAYEVFDRLEHERNAEELADLHYQAFCKNNADARREYFKRKGVIR